MRLIVFRWRRGLSCSAVRVDLVRLIATDLLLTPGAVIGLKRFPMLSVHYTPFNSNFIPTPTATHAPTPSQPTLPKSNSVNSTSTQPSPIHSIMKVLGADRLVRNLILCNSKPASTQFTTLQLQPQPTPTNSNSTPTQSNPSRPTHTQPFAMCSQSNPCHYTPTSTSDRLARKPFRSNPILSVPIQSTPLQFQVHSNPMPTSPPCSNPGQLPLTPLRYNFSSH